MDRDEESRRRELALIEEAKASKEEEMAALDRMLEESLMSDPTKPRFSLARTPPGSRQVTPPPQPMPRGPPAASTSKRHLTSPEDVQDAIRRRITEKRTARTATSSAPPIAGINSYSSTPASYTSCPSARANRGRSAAPVTDNQHAVPADMQLVDIASDAPSRSQLQPTRLDKQDLINAVHTAVKGISSVANAANKLNVADKTAIAGYGQDILAQVAQLTVRLADVELELAAAKLQLVQSEAKSSVQGTVPTILPATQQVSNPMVPNYANALKMPKGKPPIEIHRQGPSVIFYPISEDIKSSDDTKKVLQEAVKPADTGIKVSQVRRVGNAGIVVRTATEEGAQRLRDAVPPGLRVAVPKPRTPRVALRYIRAKLTGEETIREIHRINIASDPEWPLSRFQAECKFGVAKALGPKYLVILECSKAARDKLVGLGRVYVGWDEAEVCDHIRSTCCSKCQQYGHPEKYCRSKEATCGKCGELGHRADACTSKSRCCATCKRFKRADADTHVTAAASCPARLHAEQQEAQKTMYR